jgi:hypothetical protein
MIASEVARALDALSPPVAVPTRWDDVVGRAGARSPRPRRMLVLAAAAAAAIPALAVGGVLAFHGGTPLRVGADIHVGGFSARLVAQPAKSFRHVGSPRVVAFTRDVDWRLAVTGARGPVRARILVPGSRALLLCDPCRPAAAGRMPTRGGVWLKLVGGRTRLELRVGGRVLTARLRRDGRR